MSELKTLNGYKLVDTDARESINALNEEMATKVPSGAAALQMLVTDAEGNAKWEDRTHCSYTLLNETPLIDNQTVSFEAQGDVYAGTVEVAGNLYPQDTKVIWDGKEYFLTGKYAWNATENAGYTLIGNMHLLYVMYGEEAVNAAYDGQGIADTDTGEPFLFFGVNGTANPMTVVTLDNSSTHTITCVYVYSGVKKLDAKYLPTIIIEKWGEDSYDCTVPYAEFEDALKAGCPAVYIDSSTDGKCYYYNTLRIWTNSSEGYAVIEIYDVTSSEIKLTLQYHGMFGITESGGPS